MTEAGNSTTPSSEARKAPSAARRARNTGKAPLYRGRIVVEFTTVLELQLLLKALDKTGAARGLDIQCTTDTGPAPGSVV
jgi:hypothetical protein